MRTRVAIVVGLLAIAGIFVWWLRRGGDAAPATHAGGSAAAVTQADRPAARAPARPASVRGKVTRKADGTGVAAAVVSLARAELGASFSQVTIPTIVVSTDDTGAWEAKAVQPGDYMIAATAKGFLPSAREKITIASGEERTGIDLALESGGTKVSGTVSDVGGGPVAAARVTARRSERSLKAGAELVAVTGADGTYELSLPDAAYRLTAEHDDYTSDDEFVEVAGKPVVADFTLIPGAVIRGVVVARDTRKPVPGAMVQAEQGRGRGRDSTTFADEEGKFVLRSLGSGAVSLTARARGYASASPTTVQVGIGEEAEDVQVLVDGAFSIIGKTVKKGTQEPIAGARLGGFSMTGGGAEALAPSDADGMFEIAGLRPGSYMIFAAAENTMIEIGKQVEVVDKDVTGVVIELGTGISLAGRVEPAGPATVGLELEGEVGLANMFDAVKTMMVKGEADASGAFKLANVPPGKFLVTAHTRDGSTGKQAVTVAAVDQTGVVVMLTKRASIAGRVVDTNGKPQGGIRVMASPEEKKTGFRLSSTMMDRDVTTAPDGTFKLVGLEAGKYDVRVRDFEAMIAGARDKDRKKNLVELTEGQARTGVTVTVEARDLVIKGTVVGADGKPVADAWVTATRELPTSGDEPEVRMRWGRAQSDPALSGADGRFTITKLRAGTYTLVADGPRGASRGEKKGIKAGDSTQIQLASLGTLVVTVTQRNQPVKAYDLACDSAAFDVERHAASEDGSYKLENLPPGEYTCKVDSELGTGEGKIAVPTSETKLAISLSVFGSLAGQVVSVLSGKPVPDLDVVAQNEGRSQRAFLEAMTGKGVKTDKDGKFVVERVPAGKGKLMFAGKAGFSAMESSDYVAREGERVDLGQIKIVPPRTTEAGTYGFATEAKGEALEITSVTPGSPAEAAGLAVGDRIITVETIPLPTIGVDIVKHLLSSGTVGVGQTVHLGLEKGTTATVTSVKW